MEESYRPMPSIPKAACLSEKFFSRKIWGGDWPALTEKFTFLVAHNENKNLSLVELAGSGVN
jgi:hypothetical protein